MTDASPTQSAAPAATPANGSGAHGADTATVLDVRLKNLTKRFDDVAAVDDLSLDIERGCFVALLGPSGCGKTTTLRMIGGFEEPTSGQIMLGDRDVASQPAYKRDVNTVFQSYALFPHLSSFENVAFGLRRRKVKGDEVRRRTADALELVGLAGMEKRKPSQMSGGQQQRVALARALVNRPRVLLLDEPLGALDLKLRKQMQLELKSIQREVGLTFIHVTHDQEEAMTMADQIIVMNHGKIEQAGTAEELYDRPRTAFVAGFLGVSNLLEASVVGADRVRLTDGSTVSVPERVLAGRTGELAIGIRPEKIQVGGDEANRITGTVAESAYIGVSTQYIVDTPAGSVTVYVQNARAGATAHGVGDALTLSWSPECTFVVERGEVAE
jgi:spermidine/putrescine transport system ATP-binding protein